MSSENPAKTEVEASEFVIELADQRSSRPLTIPIDQGQDTVKEVTGKAAVCHGELQIINRVIEINEESEIAIATETTSVEGAAEGNVSGGMYIISFMQPVTIRIIDNLLLTDSYDPPMEIPPDDGWMDDPQYERY